MSTRDEIQEYLEGKKLKSIVLPENSNDIDQSGAAAKEEKIGQKSSLARAEYIQVRDRKILAGDRLAINEFMTEQTELRQKLEQQRERQRLEYDLLREEEKLKKKLSRITPEDMENERLDVEKLGRKREAEINNVLDYFNCTVMSFGKSGYRMDMRKRNHRLMF